MLKSPPGRPGGEASALLAATLGRAGPDEIETGVLPLDQQRVNGRGEAGIVELDRIAWALVAVAGVLPGRADFDLMRCTA